VSNLLILRHIDPLIGNDRETNKEKTAIARRELRKYAIVVKPLLGSGPRATVKVLLEEVFVLWFPSAAISLDRSS
jgi:hypothetical protein